MELPGVRYLKPGPDNVAILDPSDVARAPHELVELIDKLGADSSKTQGLRHTITTFDSFANSENRIYILLDKTHRIALGFLKVGFRRLYIYSETGIQHEIVPLCLLDFFICNVCQRHGYGRIMYDSMLRSENVEPRMIAIDRPSKLCLSFMKKHFGLENFVPQTNNYVVFDDYFMDRNREAKAVSKTPTKSPRPSLEMSGYNPAHAATPKKQRYNPITWEPL